MLQTIGIVSCLFYLLILKREELMEANNYIQEIKQSFPCASDFFFRYLFQCKIFLRSTGKQEVHSEIIIARNSNPYFDVLEKVIA